MHEFSTRAPGPPDGLFLERLDTFMDKCLADIKAFSEREYRPFDETRQHVAEWHSKYLFQAHSTDKSGVNHDTASRVRAVLYDASRILESLCEVSGVQSFILAIDPNNPSDMGFLGGPVVGREFWRGMRGGGDAGAKAFKMHCTRDLESYNVTSVNNEEANSSRASSVSTRIAPARSLKSELYLNVRKALRLVSGIRNAEMKWTNPERLDVYGVRLIGWPPSIPTLNPSSLKAKQNKILKECLENGTMRFEKLFPAGAMAEHADNYNLDDDGKEPDETDNIDDFSWAYDADAGDSPPETAHESITNQTADIFTSIHSQGMHTSPQMQHERPWSPDLLASQPSTLLSSIQLSSSRKRPRSDSDYDGALDT